MSIPAYLKCGFGAITIAIVFCGCASIGKDFKYQNVGLVELGQLRSSDYQAMLGKPDSVEVKETADGKFELVTFGSAAVGIGYSARWRTLILEFRDGILNAYSYANNFDKTSINTERLGEIKPNASKKEDVLRTLGKPDGKGLCPTYSAFQEVCEKGHEIWVWTSMERGFNAKAKVMMVCFDKDGVVTVAEEVKSTVNVR